MGTSSCKEVVRDSMQSNALIYLRRLIMTFPVNRSYTTFAEMLHATQSLILLCSYVTFPRTLEEVPDNEHL